MEFGSFVIKAIGLGLFLPGLIALFVPMLLYRAARLRPSLPALAAPVALAGGFCAACWSLELVPIRPTRTGAEWLPALSLIAIPAGWLYSNARLPQLTFFVLATTAFASAVPMIPGYVTVRLGHAAWTFVLGECILVLALVLQRAADDFPAPLFTALLAACAIVQSAILMLSGSASLAQMSGAEGAALAGIAVAPRLFVRESDSKSIRGVIPGFAVLSTGLLSCNYHDSPGGWSQAYNFVALLAPLGLSAAALLPPKRFPLRLALAIGLTAALLGFASYLAYRSSSL